MTIDSVRRPRRLGGIVILLLGVLAASAVAQTTASAPTIPVSPAAVTKAVEPASGPAAGKSKLVTNVFFETNLRQALSDVAAQTGVIIVPDTSVQGLVTCNLKDAPLNKALEIILAGTGFVVKEMPGYYMVCSAAIDGPSYPLVSETKVVKLDYVSAEAVVKMLATPFRPYAQADPMGNSLSITAPRIVLERICEDINLIDRAPGHVMLEARVVVLEQSDLLNLGVKWDWPQIRAGLFTNSDFHGGGLSGPSWPWGIQIGYTPGKEFTNSLLLTLNLLAKNEEATIVANPQIMAQDGKEAQIKVTTEEYFQIVTTGIYVNAQLEKIESGTTLKIIPRMSSGNEVTLDILVEVSDVVARGENNLPVVSRRSAKSTVRLQNGGTAAIGGLMDTRSQDIRTRTPGLGEVPWLGRLFRTDNNSTSTKQVAVFITASVVEGRQPAAEGPARHRQAIPPVDAEEFRKALNKTMQGMGEQP